MICIVVIEDSPTQAAAVRILLRRAGYDVVVAEDGEAGLEACRTSNVDLVLTDIVMPGIDGYAVTRALKADPATVNVPVIVMTTLEDPSYVLEAVKAGADNYITKPLVSDTVLARVARALEGPDESHRPLLRPALVDILVSCLEDAALRHETLAQKQAEVERTNTQREEAMRVFAHEMRGPLQALAMRGAALGAMSDPTPLLATLPADIHTQVQSMVRVIDDLTDLTDLDLGRMTIRSEEVDCVAMLEQLVEEFRGLHPDRDLSLELRSCAPIVHADRVRLRQVVRNLLTNAIKYTDGPVEIGLGDVEDALEVQVRDRGPGLSTDGAARVFKRYAREASSEGGKPRGAGLGLYICRQIIELHRGTMGVDAELGRGCTFWFRVPRG